MLCTLDAPERRPPGPPSPGNGGWSGGRSPAPAQGRVDPEEAPPCTGVLWPSRLGRGHCKQSCSGCPGDAIWGTDSDSPVPRGPSRGLGPWIPAERPWSPTGRGCTVLPEGNWSQAATGPSRGWGDPELRAPAHATQLARRFLCRRQSQPNSRLLPALGSREPPGYRSRRGGSAWLLRPGPSAAVPAPGPRRLCGAERSWAERSARCSLAFRKATLAAGRRDAGLTHARARVNARLPGCVRGSDGGHKRRGGQGEGEGLPKEAA